MKQLRAKTWFVFLLFWVGIAGAIQAQNWYHYAPPPNEFDWEIFAPLSEFDFGTKEAPSSSEGYFFSASRMKLWTSRPTRTAIGNVSQNPEPVYLPNGVAYGYFAAIAPLDGATDQINFLQVGSDGGSFGLQFNSVSDAVPDSVSGWGNRIELGWVQSDTMTEGGHKTGWMVSVLSGIDMNDTHSLGFDDQRIDELPALQGAAGLDGIDGIPDADFADQIDAAIPPVPPVAGSPGIQSIPYSEGLTTVHINFADPFDVLLGYTDTDADLLPDDINGDGVITPADRVRLGVVFDDLEFTNRTKISGVELLAIRRKKKLHGNASAEMFLGARFLKINDTFRATGRGGILADSNWNNSALNRIVGPEFGLRVVKRSRRWSTVVSGRFMAGANLLDIRQQGALGDHLATTGPTPTGAATPGVPLSYGGMDFVNRLRDERFSPVGEFRLQTSFHVTRGMKLKAGWEGMIVGGVARGSNTIAYSLPALGIVDRSEEIFSHGLTFGLEINR